jgi:hypothetical protein
LTCPEALGPGPADADREGAEEGVVVGPGVLRGFFEGLLDGEGRLVEEASGFDSCVVASAAVMGSARGGS